MDAARLSSLADLIIEDFSSSNIIVRVQELTNAFRQSVKTPTAETAAAFETAKRAFDEAAQTLESKRLPSSKLAMLERIHSADLVGEGLITRVNQILTAGVSPATIVDGLEQLAERMTKLRTTLVSVRDAFDHLDIKSESIPSNEALTEISLPGKLFDDSLSGLARESKKLNQALLTIVEAATGSRPPLQIQTVSTGSLDIICVMDLASATLLMSVTLQILTTMTAMLTLAKVYLDLKHQKAPPDLLKQLEAWHQEKIDAAIKSVKEEVVNRIQNQERRAELTTDTERAIRYLADRIDRGMRINVELSPETGEQVEPLRQELIAVQRQVIERTAEVRQLATSEAPVLALPPAPDEESTPPLIVKE